MTYLNAVTKTPGAFLNDGWAFFMSPCFILTCLCRATHTLWHIYLEQKLRSKVSAELSS